MENEEPSAASVSWTVPDGEKPVRLDAFVRRALPHLSLREIHRAIDEGGFRIGRRRGKKGDAVGGGDVVSFRGAPEWLASAPPPRANLAVAIRYEDASVLCADKPAGMATHGFSGRETASLANFLAAARPDLAGIGPSRWQPGLVNRLDRGTSGLVLAAKTPAAFDDLRAQSRRGAIQKKYWALVEGETKNQGAIEIPLIHDPRDRAKMAPATSARTKRAPRSWNAATRFRRRAAARGFTLLEVEIERGVTHQIRVHLQAAGHPIVGDPLYGGGRARPFALARQFLHAYYLAFRHPATGGAVEIKSPLPADLNDVLTRLGIRHLS